MHRVGGPLETLPDEPFPSPEMVQSILEPTSGSAVVVRYVVCMVIVSPKPNLSLEKIIPSTLRQHISSS